jgi:3-ketosteroid 9alpha-monooxygenase subunit B
MALSPSAGLARDVTRDHGFHTLGVLDVVAESRDARSFVLDIPVDLRAGYAYEAGQFLTFRCRIDGDAHLRSYSMSSSPLVDDRMQVTVKRMPGGLVSNWMIDTLRPGDLVEVTLPSGVFGRRVREGDFVAFAGGSGITPILSVLKTFLETSPRRARLFYANRDTDSVIFDSALQDLVVRSRGRLEVVHHLDTDTGLVGADEIAAFAGDCGAADVYLCGPGPFMVLVESVLSAAGASPETIHIERFSPAEETMAPPPPDDAVASRVTIELDGRIEVSDHRPGTTLLQTARQLGMSPPFSCEAGNCATCVARLREGRVTMYVNNALTDEEIAEGWALTCQAVPNTPSVRVVYGWEED